MLKKTILTGMTALTLAGVLAGCGTNTSGSSNSNNTNASVSNGTAKHKYVIALSNAYYGNTWRHQMVNAFTQAAQQAKSQGLISGYIVENGDGSVNQQMSQLNDLILKHVNMIVIDAASPTALNGTIAKAEAAGIKVVSFDSVVTEPKAYKLNFSFVQLGQDMANYVVSRLHGQGNVVLVRGVAGSAPDHDMYQGMMDVISKNPGLKVVGTVYGQATTSVTESQIAALIPSLPKVDAVLCQGGGDDYGVVQAFQGANKPMPIITAGGDAEFIHWWIQEHAKNGYTTYSENSTPGVGSAAFWVGYDILNGATPPKTMIMPNNIITQSNLSQFRDMKPNTIASPVYSNGWVQQHILNKK